MIRLLKTLLLLAAPAAAPAWAAQPDPHAGHHAEAAPAAKPAPKPEPEVGRHACPMMDAKMASADGKASKGKAPEGKMMMEGKEMRCMPAQAAAMPAEPAHDHDHPDAAQKSPETPK